LKPLLEVEVAPDETKRLPPVIVTPPVDDKPPTCAESPPRRVEVEVLRTDKLGRVVVPKKLGMFVARSAPPVIVVPLEEEIPPVETPPAKVEVAVDVAWIAATYGVVVAVTFPELSNASKVEGLTFARFKIVPASKVRVPDVKLSEVSERRNDKESIPSKVAAFEETQVPFTSLKHPPESEIPLLNVEVAPDVSCNAPPLITIPDEVALKPGTTNPEYKVEVPDWKLPTDWTERMEPGLVVPIPTLPSISKFPGVLNTLAAFL